MLLLGHSKNEQLTLKNNVFQGIQQTVFIDLHDILLVV